MIKQQHVAALLAEFIGTLTLALIVLGVGVYRFPIFTALAAGTAVVAFFNIFGKVSGAHLNPAITAGLFAIKQISLLRAMSYWAVQFLAGFAAWQLYDKLTGEPLKSATTPVSTLGMTNSVLIFAGMFLVFAVIINLITRALGNYKLDYSIGLALLLSFLVTSAVIIANTKDWQWNFALAEFIGAFIFACSVGAVVSQKITGYQAGYSIGAGLFLGLTVATIAYVAAGTSAAATLNPAVSVATRSLDINYLAAPVAGVLVGMVTMMLALTPFTGSKKKEQVVSAPEMVAVPTPVVSKSEVTSASTANASVKKAPAKKATAKKTVAKKASPKKASTKKR